MVLPLRRKMTPSKEMAATTLVEMHPGQTAEIVEIASADQGRLMKLAALGVAPGAIVHLQQRRPAYVIRVGETLLSIAREIAADIHVYPIS